MEKCVRCGADAELYVKEVPVCLDCDGKRAVPITATPSDQPKLPAKALGVGASSSLPTASLSGWSGSTYDLYGGPMPTRKCYKLVTSTAAVDIVDGKPVAIMVPAGATGPCHNDGIGGRALGRPHRHDVCRRRGKTCRGSGGHSLTRNTAALSGGWTSWKACPQAGKPGPTKTIFGR
jgi:hypothetical protein